MSFDESTRESNLSGKFMIDTVRLQELQDVYAQVANLFIFCVDEQGKRVTEMSGNPEEIARVVKLLDEMQITPESLETVSVQEGGRLTSLSTNTVQANKLKNMITLRVQEAIQDIRNKRTDVPLGTIIGSDLWGGMGPGIPVCISLSGSVSSDFEEKLESGGINQTVHKLSVRVSADIHVIMPAGSGSERVETTVLIGETVIVGKTPDGIINGHFGTEG